MLEAGVRMGLLRLVFGRCCGGPVWISVEGTRMVVLAAASLLHRKQLTKNWSGQGESDCLIKTKHCDGRRRC